MRQQELKNPGQKTRLTRSKADGTGIDAGDRKKTWQKFGIGRNEAESLNGHGFRLFTH